MPGSWTALTDQPSSHNFFAGTMILLTDGTVMCQDEGEGNGGSKDWWKLTPDASGSYINGAWSQLQSGPNAPLYYASAVLKDGSVFMAGGEDNAGVHVNLLAAEIYDPVANSWQVLTPPAGWTNIGDAPSCVLPDGTVLLGSINDTKTAIYDPVTQSFSAGPSKNDPSEEETWTLLPDETVLVAECTNHPAAEKYVAAADQWKSAGSIPAGHDLVQSSSASSDEIGPAILMPDGRVLAIGASGHTALYTMPAIANQPGTWAPGPDFPADSNGNLWQAFDAPACLLPNGNVLCVAGPIITSGSETGWSGQPVKAFEFDGTNLNPVPDPPNAANSATWQTRMLLLPTGEVLFSNGSGDIRVYQPDGSPDSSWAPEITDAPANVQPGHSYTLKGRQLNGLSQANSYGDDAQMATNYPIVRIRNLSTNHVLYCRTHDHSTMGVATGSVVQSTNFDVPAVTELGASELCVIANGIATCQSVLVNNKRWKELKWEIKEGKELIERFKQDEDVLKLVVEIPKLKDAEGDPFTQYGIDPEALVTFIGQIAERADQLQEQVLQLQAFIQSEERPNLGETALNKSGGSAQQVTAQPKKSDDKSS